MEKVKKLIIILAIIIICLIIIILNIVKDDENNTNNENNIEVESIVHAIDSDTDETQLLINSNFFTVSNCVSRYLDAINKNNSIYYGYDDEGNYILVENLSNNILQLLSDKYLQENNITFDTLEDKITLLEEKVVFVPINMKVVVNDEIEKYLVYGKTISLEYEYISDVYMFVNLDETNSTFSIEPINEKIDGLESKDYTNNETTIENNGANIYQATSLNREDMCKKYMEILKQLFLSAPEFAYEYFDDEYAEKRFGSVDNFISYIESNRENILNIKYSKYLVEDKEEYLEYVVQDQYENFYIFDVTSIMNFTLKLDTYTISTEKFSISYASASNQKKVQMNIDKFFQMINRHDYRTSYSCLVESFKNNYVESEEVFQKIAESKFFEYNTIGFSDFDTIGNNTFMCEVNLSDLTDSSSETKKITFIMKLNDGEDFEMSFDVE